LAKLYIIWPGKVLEAETRLEPKDHEQFDITLQIFINQIIKQQNTLICRILISQINYWPMAWARVATIDIIFTKAR